jgi:hypothetical protein
MHEPLDDRHTISKASAAQALPEVGIAPGNAKKQSAPDLLIKGAFHTGE